jgi:hypothetical protein
MREMFSDADKFNQNLCAWKNTMPFEKNTDMFLNSGCSYQTIPTLQDGPFCKVASCIGTAKPTAKPTSKITPKPTTKPTAKNTAKPTKKKLK